MSEFKWEEHVDQTLPPIVVNLPLGDKGADGKNTNKQYMIETLSARHMESLVEIGRKTDNSSMEKRAHLLKIGLDPDKELERAKAEAKALEEKHRKDKFERLVKGGMSPESADAKVNGNAIDVSGVSLGDPSVKDMARMIACFIGEDEEKIFDLNFGLVKAVSEHIIEQAKPFMEYDEKEPAVKN